MLIFKAGGQALSTYKISATQIFLPPVFPSLDFVPKKDRKEIDIMK